MPLFSALSILVILSGAPAKADAQSKDPYELDKTPPSRKISTAQSKVDPSLRPQWLGNRIRHGWKPCDTCSEAGAHPAGPSVRL